MLAIYANVPQQTIGRTVVYVDVIAVNRNICIYLG